MNEMNPPGRKRIRAIPRIDPEKLRRIESSSPNALPDREAEFLNTQIDESLNRRRLVPRGRRRGLVCDAPLGLKT
jgi:hypothetical protein